MNSQLTNSHRDSLQDQMIEQCGIVPGSWVPSPAQDWNFFRQKMCNCHCHLKTKEPVDVEVEACVEILPNASVITCQCRGSLYLCFYEHISCQVLFINLCLLFVLGN